MSEPTELVWVQTSDRLPGCVGDQTKVLMWNPDWCTYAQGMVTRWANGEVEWATYDQHRDRYYLMDSAPEFWAVVHLPVERSQA